MSVAASVRERSGRLAPDRTIPAAHRGMLVVLELAAQLPPATPVPTAALAAQLSAWAQSRPGEPEAAPGTLLRGVLLWSRLHGLASIEIEGTFALMGLDPALLYAAELDQLLRGS